MSIPPIKAFPQDDFYWRIDWIDDPLNSPDSEPRIKVYLSRLVDDYISSSLRPLNNSSLYKLSEKVYVHKVIYLKVGLIQILDIGSVWRNGFRQLETESTFINEKIEFNLLDTELIPLTKHGKFGRKDEGGNTDWQEVLTDYQYRLSSQEILKGKWVVIISNNLKYNKIIVPVSVIFQNCYVSSPKAARKIIYGQLNKLIDFSESGFLNEYPDIFRACLFKDYKDTEALLLSNLLANPLAKINLDILRRNLVMSANSVNEPLGLLRLNFPFDNIKLKVKGKVLPYHNTKDKGFLVTQLSVTHAKFPFKTIIPNRKNDGRKGKEKEDNLEPAYPVSSGTSQSYNDDGVNGLPITNNDVYNFLDEIEIEAFGGLECNNVNIIKEEKERQRYESAMHVPSFQEENGSSISTGPTHSSQTGTHELSIVTSPASLEDFFAVISYMKSKGFDIESIGISKDVKYTERGVINYFPRRLSSVRTWHLTKNKERTRFFVIAKILYKGNYYYLIEVEHKGTEVLSVAFIYSRNMQEITNDELLLFMRNVAIKNGWPFLHEDNIYIKKWKCETIKHNRVSVVKSLYKKILDILERQ